MEIVIYIGAIATATGATWKWAIVPLFKFTRRVIHVVDALEAVAPHLDLIPASLPTLIDIAAEFKPNHGQSLVDRMGHVETVMCEVQRAVEQHALAHRDYT